MSLKKGKIMELTEKWVKTEEIFDGTILHVQKDEVELPNGNHAYREIIRHVGAVCVVPLTDDGYVIMERQYRYAVAETIFEIPAGKLDSKSEEPEAAIRRELREETGYIAGRLIHLGYFYPAAAYSDEKINMYLAMDLRQAERALDEDEFINLEKIKLEELAQLVVDGKIPDLKTQAAIMRTLYMKEHGML